VGRDVEVGGEIPVSIIVPPTLDSVLTRRRDFASRNHETG